MGGAKKITATELGRLVKEAMAVIPGCRGVKAITVFRDYKVRKVTWNASVLDAGPADRARCAAAVPGIVRRLRDFYELP